MKKHKKTAAKKVDGREQRSEESRSRILSAATIIFARKGPEGSRVDEIAKKAGINKRMIYHYFGSKENLYVEVLRYNYKKIYALSKKTFDIADDPKMKLTCAIKAYFYFLAENEAFVRLTNWESLNGGRFARKIIPQFFDLMELEFDEIIHDGIERGFIRPDIDIRHVVLSVHALCLIYFTRKEIVHSLWQENYVTERMLEARLQHILSLVLNGILNHED